MNVQKMTTRSASACWVLILHSIAGGTPPARYTDEGFTEPERTVRVAASDVGVLASFSHREGDRIRAGEPICSLDTSVLAAALRAAESRLASEGKIDSALAKLRHHQNHLQQIIALRDKTHASNLEVTDAELDVALAQADLRITQEDRIAIQMEIEKVQAQLDQRVVLAPIDGLILELPKQAGEALTSMDNHVATIVNLDRLRVRYYLSTENAFKLGRGQVVRVFFPSTGQRTDATVDFISPITDANSGTVRVELMLDNSLSKFRAGLRCQIEGAGNASEPTKSARQHFGETLQPRR